MPTVRCSSLFLAILLSCKGDPAPAPAPASGSGPPPAKVTNVEAPKAPTLPERTVPAGKSPNAIFEAEQRDNDWAPDTEGKIKERLKLRAGTVESIECRQSQCRLSIGGTETDVGKAIADLEGHRGLHGYAKNVLLTAPEKKSDGTIVLRAYALFDR